MKLSYAIIAASRYFSSKASQLKKDFRNRCGVKNVNVTPIVWTDEQKQVIDAASSGKSIFITGSAGTGKTFLLKHVISELCRIYGRSSVYVTASTGVSACALNGQTIHSFAGIGLGEMDSDSLLRRIRSNVRAVIRWEKVKVLCIDELSMISAELFEKLERIARTMKNNGKTWGGIQLIGSGDFCQLAPVIKGPEKECRKIYAFEADCWDASFSLQKELGAVFRQSDRRHVELLQKMRKGMTKHEDLELLKNLSRDEPDPSAVRLYPKIVDVNRVNKEKLDELGKDRKIWVYDAVDKGEDPWIKQLESGIAPTKLELCVGARVMLIQNINLGRKLVNGATGTVVSFRKNLPSVQFDSGITYLVKRRTWDVMDGDELRAQRRQIPLILAWAISIHKSQGITLDKLDTNLSGAFGRGMVYVALSRVTSLKGIRLLGPLYPSAIKAHPKVIEFYNRLNSGQVENKEVPIVGVGSSQDQHTGFNVADEVGGIEDDSDEEDVWIQKRGERRNWTRPIPRVSRP